MAKNEALAQKLREEFRLACPRYANVSQDEYASWEDGYVFRNIGKRISFLRTSSNSDSGMKSNPHFYSMFKEGTNNFPLVEGPSLKTIEEFGADSEAVVFVEKGDSVVYDRFGCPKNVSARPNLVAREISRLALRDTYINNENKERRIGAGRELGYSEPRIALGEWIRGKLGL